MLATIKIPETLSVFERALAAGVLFYGAVVFCLPVEVLEDVAYPWWASKIRIGNVLLHELLFLVWIALYGSRFVLRALLNGGIPTRQAALWLIALALWCGVISLATPLPLQDLGRSLRLLLYAVMLLAVVRWTRRMGNFPLLMLILGFFTGTIINLVVSFQNPLIVNEVMRLSGQNTPGVAMGIAIHLSAWLFFHTSRRAVQTAAVIAAIVFAFGCGISYSRIGWFAGGLGLIAWVYILIAARPRERKEKLRLKKTRRVWIPLLALGMAALLTSPLAQENLQWIQTLAEQKFSGLKGGGDVGRVAYVQGVAEILLKYPLGVGYSGFFDAMTATAVYRSGKANKEESLDANPHATFLWYASAGGIPGGFMAMAVFIMLLNSMRFGLLSAMGRPGLVLFALVALPFLLIGLTVTYLLNSIILFVPAGIAAGWGWTRRVGSAEKRGVPPTWTAGASVEEPIRHKTLLMSPDIRN
jgi:hypothetical protein